MTPSGRLFAALALLRLGPRGVAGCLTCCVEPLPDGTCCCVRPPSDHCPPLPPSCPPPPNGSTAPARGELPSFVLGELLRIAALAGNLRSVGAVLQQQRPERRGTPRPGRHRRAKVRWHQKQPREMRTAETRTAPIVPYGVARVVCSRRFTELVVCRRKGLQRSGTAQAVRQRYRERSVPGRWG